MWAYYNEIDPYPAQWLKNLIADRLIPRGEVDERSILQVEPDELGPFRQCHFFAGIGGWAYALTLADWPEDREVWTASCPCQPLSSAGRRGGHADERHLWPAFYRLVAECKPATIFGEQVSSRDGREWLAGIRADLEHLGYAVGCADLPAACVGAPHIRQRLFWVAQSAGERKRQHAGSELGTTGAEPEFGYPTGTLRLGGSGATGGVADAASERGREGRSGRQPGPAAGLRDEAQRNRGQDGGVGIASVERREELDLLLQPRQPRQTGADAFWSGAAWLPCLDGKARRVEPGTFPLADGVPSRVGRLRGYGNAIVPQVAAEFIRAAVDGFAS